MRVESISTIPVSIPKEKAYQTSLHDATDSYDHLVIVVKTDEGVSGVGEVAPAPYWPRGMTRDSCKSIIDTELAPLLTGKSLFRIPRHVESMERRAAGLPFARYGLDVAMYDALGKSLEVPCYDLLGGPTNPERTIGMHYSIGLSTPEEMVAEAKHAFNSGISDLKIKVGGSNPNKEREGLEAVASGLPNVRIRVDANQGWKPDEAIRRISELDAAANGLELVEQPVECDDLSGLVRVRAAVTPPILADEACFSPRDVVRLAERKAADVVNIKLGKTGGLTGARKFASVAEAHGLTCFVGSMEELGIGAAASMHMAVATPAVTYPTGVLNTHPEQKLISNADEWTNTGARFRVSDAPGLGVDPDWETIETYRVDR